MLRLARVAADAERLRLTLLIRRTVIRAAIGAVGAIFLLGALGFAHLAVYLALRPHFTPLQDALVVMGGDAVLAIVLLVVALRSSPGAQEREARTMRDVAASELYRSPASLLRGPLTGILTRFVMDAVFKRFTRRGRDGSDQRDH